VTPAIAVMHAKAVTSTTAMIPEIAVTPGEAETQSAAHEFYGDSQKNLLNGKNSYSLYSIILNKS
jgi:hypothetical protein